MQEVNMAESRCEYERQSSRQNGLGATWAGVFTFAAIWSTFEMLGTALFGSSSGPKKEKANQISQTGLYLCRQRPTLPHTWRVQYHRPSGA